MRVKTKWYSKHKTSIKNKLIVETIEDYDNIRININNTLPNKKILKDLYVPSSCLQGSELQIHLLWPDTETVEVHIEKPNYFNILRLHNCERYVKYESTIVINNFEVNGYLGIVFKTSVLKDFAIDDQIKFTIYSIDGIQEEIKTIHLFRPYVKLISVPETIHVKKGNNGKPIVDTPIKVKNYGEGLALLSFDFPKKCEIKLGPPKNSDIFLLNFRNDLISNLKDIKPSYPDYNYIFDKLFSLEDKLFNNYNKKLIKELDELGTEMRNVFEKDKDFTKVWVECITDAYIKNINKIVDAESFIAYMKSTEKNRVLLLDSILVLKINKEIKRLVAELKIKDLASHEYEPLKIETTIYADDEIDISVFELLKVVGALEVVT